MARLRIRFKLNPGREGIALGKLSKQTENMELFLRSLASDLGIQDAPNSWIASKFRNGSVLSTTEFQAVVETAIAAEFNNAVTLLTKYKLPKKTLPEFISASTLDRFSNLRQNLDADENIGLGVIDVENERKVKWAYINRTQLEEISNSIETETIYIGAVMGSTYEWNKGADKPYLLIRELTTGDLVKCFYNDDDYDQVAKLFSKKTAVVIVEGTIAFNRITEKSEVLKADQFDFAPQFSDEDFEKFFGCAPDMTGQESAADFIAKGRSHEH